MSRRDEATRLRVTVALAMAGALWHTVAAQPAPPSAKMGVAVAADQDHLIEIRAAADDALARYAEWLGPPSFDRIEILDRSSPPAADARTLAVAVDLPFSAAPSLMIVESQVAYGVALGWLAGLRTRDDRVPLDQGLAWYLQSRIVERLFNLKTGATAYSSEHVALFGGGVRRPVPSLRLSRWTAGLGRDVFLGFSSAADQRWPSRRLPIGMAPQAVRAALAFGTLERWLGWPTVQGALATLVQQSRGRELSARDAVGILGTALGQDVSWFFDQVLDPARDFDYALDTIDVRQVGDGCGAASCYRTEVVALRRGTATFTGTSKPPLGEYASGDALELRVEFEDGESLTTRWDGRAERHTFVFDSTARPRRVTLDPERVLLLNRDPLATRRSLAPATNVPIGKWVARWAIWLQDAVLAYTALL